MRVDFSDGNWVDLLDVDQVRDYHRKAANKTIRIVVTDEGEAIMGGDYEDRMRDALLRELVVNWSFDLPVPSKDITSLDKLTIKQARELNEAIDPHFALIREGSGPGSDRKSVPTSG